MEFLMTYGWAILIMLVVIAVLFYVGVLSPRNVAPNSLTLPPGFSAYDYSIDQNGNLHLDLGHGLGNRVYITGVACTDNIDMTNPHNVNIALDSGKHAMVDSGTTINCAGAEEGVYYRGNILIWYTQFGTSLEHKIVGDIGYKVGGESSTGGGGYTPGPTNTPGGETPGETPGETSEPTATPEPTSTPTPEDLIEMSGNIEGYESVAGESPFDGLSFAPSSSPAAGVVVVYERENPPGGTFFNTTDASGNYIVYLPAGYSYRRILQGTGYVTAVEAEWRYISAPAVEGTAYIYEENAGGASNGASCTDPNQCLSSRCASVYALLMPMGIENGVCCSGFKATAFHAPSEDSLGFRDIPSGNLCCHSNSDCTGGYTCDTSTYGTYQCIQAQPSAPTPTSTPTPTPTEAPPVACASADPMAACAGGTCDAGYCNAYRDSSGTFACGCFVGDCTGSAPACGVACGGKDDGTTNWACQGIFNPANPSEEGCVCVETGGECMSETAEHYPFCKYQGQCTKGIYCVPFFDEEKGGSCSCQPESITCSESAYPTCGGACPDGFACQTHHEGWAKVCECVKQAPVCGDNVCNGDEASSTCPQDCCGGVGSPSGPATCMDVRTGQCSLSCNTYYGCTPTAAQAEACNGQAPGNNVCSGDLAIQCCMSATIDCASLGQTCEGGACVVGSTCNGAPDGECDYKSGEDCNCEDCEGRDGPCLGEYPEHTHICVTGACQQVSCQYSYEDQHCVGYCSSSGACQGTTTSQTCACCGGAEGACDELLGETQDTCLEDCCYPGMCYGNTNFCSSACPGCGEMPAGCDGQIPGWVFCDLSGVLHTCCVDNAPVDCSSLGQICIDTGDGNAYCSPPPE